LLLAPLGGDTLAGHLLSLVDTTLVHHRPLVVAPPDADDRYHRLIGAACPDVDVVNGWRGVKDALGQYEPSDTLLIIDPRCFPVGGFNFDVLRPDPAADDPRWATYFVAFEKGAGGGTKEFVNVDGEGRVRRIQRYYDAVTWPFISGVAA